MKLKYIVRITFKFLLYTLMDKVNSMDTARKNQRSRQQSRNNFNRIYPRSI